MIVALPYLVAIAVFLFLGLRARKTHDDPRVMWLYFLVVFILSVAFSYIVIQAIFFG